MGKGILGLGLLAGLLGYSLGYSEQRAQPQTAKKTVHEIQCEAEFRAPGSKRTVKEYCRDLFKEIKDNLPQVNECEASFINLITPRCETTPKPKFCGTADPLEVKVDSLYADAATAEDVGRLFTESTLLRGAKQGFMESCICTKSNEILIKTSRKKSYWEHCTSAHALESSIGSCRRTLVNAYNQFCEDNFQDRERIKCRFDIYWGEVTIGDICLGDTLGGKKNTLRDHGECGELRYLSEHPTECDEKVERIRAASKFIEATYAKRIAALCAAKESKCQDYQFTKEEKMKTVKEVCFAPGKSPEEQLKCTEPFDVIIAERMEVPDVVPFGGTTNPQRRGNNFCPEFLDEQFGREADFINGVPQFSQVVSVSDPDSRNIRLTVERTNVDDVTISYKGKTENENHLFRVDGKIINWPSDKVSGPYYVVLGLTDGSDCSPRQSERLRIQVDGKERTNYRDYVRAGLLLASNLARDNSFLKVESAGLVRTPRWPRWYVALSAGGEIAAERERKQDGEFILAPGFVFHDSENMTLQMAVGGGYDRRSQGVMIYASIDGLHQRVLDHHKLFHDSRYLLSVRYGRNGERNLPSVEGKIETFFSRLENVGVYAHARNDPHVRSEFSAGIKLRLPFVDPVLTSAELLLAYHYDRLLNAGTSGHHIESHGVMFFNRVWF